jgi:uncharacterized lipoprotein YajG
MRTLLGAAALVLAAACNPATDTTTTTPPDTTAQMETPAPAPPTVAAITEQDARSRIEGAGYTNVTGLTQTPDGTWTATGTRGGQTTTVTVTESGVTAATTTP